MLCYFAFLLNINQFERESAMHKRLYWKNHANITYIIWLISFLIGLLIAWNAPFYAGGIFLPPSFVGLFFSAVLPVVLCLLFSKAENKIALYVLGALNGFVYGFSSALIMLIFQETGSFLRVIYLLSQSSASLCVLYIGSTYRGRNDYNFKRLAVLCTSCIVVICVFHYLILTKGLLWICWI